MSVIAVLAAAALAQDPVELKQVAKLERPGAYLDPILSPDHGTVYVLDQEFAKVYKLKADDLSVAADTRTLEHARVLALTPDGKTLYVGAWKHDTTSTTFQAIDAATLEAQPEFRLDGVIVSGMVATDAGILACTMPGAKQGASNRFFAVDVAKRELLCSVDITRLAEGDGTSAGQPRIHLPPEQDRAYIMGDFAFLLVVLKPGAAQYKPRDLSGTHGSSLGLDFVIAPSGKHIIAKGGTLLGIDEGTPPLWQVDSWQAGAFSPDCKTFIVARAEGKLRHYSIAEKRAIASYRLPTSPTAMLWESKRNRLLTLTPAKSDGEKWPLYELAAYDAPR